jgi:hypothetical protein
MAFLYLTLSFLQMLKAATPVVTMLFLFAFRLEKPTPWYGKVGWAGLGWIPAVAQ